MQALAAFIADSPDIAMTAGGLLKSPRSMIMAIRSKTSLPKTPAAYLGDIK